MIWEACERFGIKPPGVKPEWEECSAEIQGLLLCYNEIRSHDSGERTNAIIKAILSSAATRGKLM